MTNESRLPGDSTGGEQVSVHRPVLVAEALAALDLRPGQVVVDGTVGAGGHSGHVLAALAPGGTLIGIDRDAAVLAHARRSLEAVASKVGGGVVFRLFHTSFSHMPEVLHQEGLSRCDRVLLDLGVSSLQLDTAARGFSFSQDAPLDMRMDADDASRPTAAQWLARASEPEIARVLWEYGEERHARRIARALVAARRVAPVSRTFQLRDIVVRQMPRRPGGIHPATRTFQAIRIQVNGELDELQRGLEAAARVLGPGGRLVVITFHSLEDRMVKHFLRQGFERVHKKPIGATQAEVQANPRARSAKLRVGVRRGDA
ncbi:MAG: 16S rRNA (cytosine(1402)-N(4))-methyltransferase RsmH [Planctomycetota bacterium]